MNRVGWVVMESRIVEILKELLNLNFVAYKEG
jgi:hypothetical protein